MKDTPECSCLSRHSDVWSNSDDLCWPGTGNMCEFADDLRLSTVIDTLHLLSSKCYRVDWLHQCSLCVLHSTCVWAARSWKRNKPLITAPNTGVENWASLQPNPRLGVQDTACCVFLFGSPGVCACTCACVHASVCDWCGERRESLCS